MRTGHSHKRSFPVSVNNQPALTRKRTCHSHGVTAVPNEVLANIFANLGCQELLACRLVSRNWRAVIDAFPKLRVADACTFYCGGDLKTPMPRAPTMAKDYYLSALNWLTGFGPEGHQAAVQLAHLVKNSDRYLPAKLLFASAQVWAKTALFSCEKVYSAQYANRVTCTCLSPNEQHFVAASQDGQVRICQQVDGRWQEALTLRHAGGVESIGFSPDSRYLVIAGGGTALLHKFGGKEWQQCAALTPCYCDPDPCFSPDGNFLVVYVGMWKISIYRLIDHQWLPQITALENEKVRDFCFHPRDNCLITAPREGRVKIWRQVNEVWKQEATLKGPVDMPAIHLSPDGSRLLVTGTIHRWLGRATTIQVWHGVNGEWTKEITFQASGVSEIRFGPCGHNFATLSTTSWALNRETKILLFCHGRWINWTWTIHQVQFSREGQRVIAIPRVGAVVVCGLDREQMHEQATLPGTDWSKDAVLSPHGNHLLTLPRQGGNAEIWGVCAGQWRQKATLPHPVEVESARFNADGRYVFTLCKDNTVNIWAVAGWKNGDSG